MLNGAKQAERLHLISYMDLWLIPIASGQSQHVFSRSKYFMPY